jgi:hypothetical protein
LRITMSRVRGAEPVVDMDTIVVAVRRAKDTRGILTPIRDSHPMGTGPCRRPCMHLCGMIQRVKLELETGTTHLAVKGLLGIYSRYTSKLEPNRQNAVIHLFLRIMY